MNDMSTHAPRIVESYLEGGWRRGAGELRPVAHAATGKPFALIGADGLDLASSMEWGRRVGGANLRKLTIHDRAYLLKQIGLQLLEIKEQFYVENTATGATRRDGWPDIDGGIGTMLTFASKARRELPNTRLLPEGPVEQLSADGSFVAQHILSPLRGIAVHINAFNFPVWGMLEKIAPTLIAGMPCLVKPASQTAYLTELVVRRILDTGLLPEGALQIVTGSARDLMDHVTGQDVVTFTGSAVTGQKLKSSPAVIENSVRFTMEADSLNAAILGEDAAPGTEEFDLFVREVSREMTSKAGQKCTAIRRVIVPHTHEAAVIDALTQRLAEIPVGLPDDKQGRMGALVSLSDRDNVREQIAKLAVEAEIVSGDPDHIRVCSGDAREGAFMNPVLLHARDPMRGQAIHSVEAFGPVATVMGYAGPEQAITLAQMGKGSLVSSLFTNDPEIASEIVTGIAPFHGRVMIGNRVSAKTSTGHGAPLAALVHGGPGRAGGGEEMGGIRGIKHFMQRTAVQGPPALLSAVTKQWTDGAPARTGTHPFRKSLAELKLGDQFNSPAREITLEDVEHFAHFTGDTFYAHMDDAAARANPFFEGRVAHGYLIASFAAGLFVDPAPGPVLANYGVDNLRFLTPVYFGDTLAVRLTCKEISPRADKPYGEVRWDCCVRKGDGTVVAQYDVLTMVAKTLDDATASIDTADAM